ncbi:MAG TPA: lipopolysaccharide biosynthesis protein [Bdellovibrionota bacterium]|jgi:O-antigen/teichoic acid export membrane protein
MSKSVKRVVKNSFFQTTGSFINSVINFVLTLGYARFLGPEIYGSLVTSQAQVLVWTLLVDLGLSNSLISALTSAEGGRTDYSRQGFRARDLLFRVLFLRLVGACIGTVFTFTVAWLRYSENLPQFWQEVAFTPHLFALALQQTGIAYSAYMHRQGLSVLATLVGVVLTTTLTLMLAAKGTAVPWLLLAQSWGGFLSAAIVFGYFFYSFLHRRRAGATRRLKRMKLRPSRGPWGGEAWRALARDAWPYALAFAVMVLWQRLDQIAASHILGLESGGQYALAVRLVSVPLLVATSISLAIFPDLQRVGRDAPHRVRLILGALSKVVYRYGVLLAACMIVGIGIVIVPLVPKFRPAVWLLPHFLPGIWAFWLQCFITNSLFGLRAYRQSAKVHLSSLAVYVVCVFSFPYLLGLPGVVWAFNVFCLCMCFFGFRAAREVGLFEPGFLVYAAYTTEERQLLQRSGVFFLRRPKESV